MTPRRCGNRGAQWGYYTDPEDGLVFMTHRYYDPPAGRFLTRDPISYAGGINLYGCCGNNPVNAVDPLGLCLEPRDNRSLWQTLKDAWGRWQRDRENAEKEQAVQDFVRQQLALGLNVLADGFSDDTFLTNQMQKAFNSQKTVGEYDDLVGKFEGGITNPGRGNGTLGKGVFYLRGDLGTRIFLKKVQDGVYAVVGIADKSNEKQVIRYLTRLFGIR